MKIFWAMFVTLHMGQSQKTVSLEQYFYTKDLCETAMIEAGYRIQKNPDLWGRFKKVELECKQVEMPGT